MTDLTADRDHQTKALIDDTRAILNTASLDRPAMGKIRDRLLQIAAQKELWNDADYPSPSGEDQQHRYLVGQENPQGISLYLNVMLSGKSIPPHNHTTWACIAAVEGVEHNTLYDRLDDGSTPGKAEICARELVVVEPGNALAMLPDDVHSFEVRGQQIIRHLHFYGRPLETLDERVTFDMANGTCKIMEMPVKTKT